MPFPIEKERCQNCGRLTCARTAADRKVRAQQERTVMLARDV